MQEKIKIDEFQKYINTGELDIAFDKIANKAIALVKEIAIMKELSIENLKYLKDIEDLFYKFERLFEENSASFQSIPTLMKNFQRWNIAPEDDFGTTKEEKINIYIRDFNSIISEFEEYEKVKKEIQEKGYEKLRDDKIKKLISLFKKMLEYKGKSYNENWNFGEWIENIDKYYHFYHEELSNVIEQIDYNTMYRNIYVDYQVCIKTDNIENIIALDELYDILSSENDGYKAFAEFYKDIELQEGQTYSDLYNEKIEKFVELFKEMLDFINFKYEKNDFFNLKVLIRNNFPYYQDNLTSLDVMMSTPTETYISLLNNMDMIYNYFSKTYRNHEENMKKYEEELKNAELDFTD